MPETPDPSFDADAATISVQGPRPTLSGSSTPDLPLPEELTNLLPHGNYQVESFLGAGGMGAVYRGTQVRLKRPVAIKIMRRDMGRDQDFEARFEREAQAMAKLNHPNIVSVIDYGEAGPDFLYIVMELIEGADLMDVIRGGEMTQEMALSLLPQICDALQFAHDHGIVHRDIKPSNIMLTRDGRIKMADFGLAKHFDAENSFRTQTGTGMGTPDYAAPEQFDPSAPIDHRADIYALGVMIYQMITGQLPRGVWKPPSQRAAVQPEWDDIVSRAMQSDPSDRYQQASEVKTDVSSISLVESRRSRQTAEVAAPAAPQPRALASTPTKSRAPLLLGLVAGAVVIALVAFFALKKPEESSRVHQDVAVAPPSPAPKSQPAPAIAGTASSSPSLPLSTSSATVTIPGLPDLPPLSVPPGEPRLVKGFSLSGGGTVRGLHLLPDSRRLLIVQDDMIKFCDLETEKQVWLIKGGKGAVSSAINGDGTRFAVVYPFDAAGKALVGPGLDGGYFEVNLCETATGNTLQSWKVPYTRMSNAYGQIALSPSGETIVVRTGGYHDGSSKIGSAFIALQAGKTDPVGRWNPTGHIGSSTHPLSETLFLSTGSGEPFQINAADPTAKASSPGWMAEVKEFSALSHDKRWLLGSNGSSCSVWDMTTGRSSLLENSEVTSGFAAFAGSGLALGKQSRVEIANRHMLVWDSATGLLLARYPPSKPGFYWGIYSAGAPNGQFFVNVAAPLPTAPNKSELYLQVWSLPKPGQVNGLVKTPTASPAIAAPTLPESGWKPLVSKEEWETNWEGSPVNYGGKLVLPNRRFNEEGLLHMQSTSLYKPSPSADGAIRVESVIRQLPHVINLGVRRRSGDQGRYAFGMGKDGNSLLMRFITTDAATWGTLQSCPLPTPLKIGDRLKLELRIQGSQITGLCNGVAVLQAQDQRLTAAGEWGLDVVDASIKSVEVQPLPASETQPQWTDALAAWWQGGTQREGWVREKDGSARLTAPGPIGIHLGKIGTTTPPIFGAQAVRARFRLGDSPYLTLGVCRSLQAEMQARGYYAAFATGKSSITLTLDSPGMASYAELAAVPLPKGMDRAATHTMELRYANQQLTLILDGQTLYEKPHTQYTQGYPMLNARQGAIVESLEIADLGGGAISPSPSLPVPKSSSPPLAPAAETWENLLSDPKKLQLGDNPGTKITAEGLQMAGKGTVWFGQPTNRNGAVKIVTSMSSQAGGLTIRGRMTADGSRIDSKFYSVALLTENEAVISLTDNAAKTVPVRRVFPISPPLRSGQEFELEVRIVGDGLTAKLNGKLLGELTDSTLQSGRFAVASPRDNPPLIKTLEYLNLDSSANPSSPNPQVSPSPSAATKDAPFINTLGMKFVPVPITGGPTDKQRVLFSIWETRVQDYEVFAKETKREWSKVGFNQGATHPAVFMSCVDAQAFCQWLTDRERKAGKLGVNEAYRLPSDHEWSCAVGIGDKEDPAKLSSEKHGKISDVFPWGSVWPPPKGSGNYAGEEVRPFFEDTQRPWIWFKDVLTGYRDDFVETSPVGSFAADRLGLFDMGGNVWEFCPDWCDKEHKAPALRGGSWGNRDRDRLLSSARPSAPNSGSGSDSHGFRCVLGRAPSTTAVSPAPNLPVPARNASPSDAGGSKSSDPKFPPGQWVKLFTKPEDLPEDLRKPGSVVRWEDGWVRFDRNASGRPRIDLPSGVPGMTNYAIRVRGIRSKDEISQTAIVLRKHETKFQQYQLSPKGVFLIINRRDGEDYPEIMRFSKPIVQSGSEYVMEFGIVGSQLVARYNDDFMRVQDTTFKQGSAYLSGKDDLSNIEVINLDGLPEAEALRLLGVDEKGNDVRGKTGAAKAWIDVLRDPSIVTLTKGAEITPEGIRLPSGSGAYVARSKSLSGDVAMRVRTTFGGPRLQLRVRGEGGRGFYALTTIDDKTVSIQRYDLAADKGISLRTFTLTSPLKPDEDYEMEFRCVGPTLTASLNGVVLGTVTDGTHTEGGCVLSAWEASQTTALAKAFSVLDLSKASASTSSSSPSLPVSKSSPSSIHTFNSHRYQLITTPSTWAEAKARAEAMGGHLATFTTEAEERWARETILQPLSAQERVSTKASAYLYWIGGHAAAQSKDFRWLSGEPVGKIGWRSGNPGWRERTDMPETKAVGALFAAGLVVMRPRPSGEWISVQQQSLLRSGFIIEWDDAGGTSSPSPNLPVPARNASRSDAGGSKSSDPKFPPGQWVKPWRSLADIPDVNVSEGWATLAASTAVANPPGAEGRNWGIRVWLRDLTSGAFKSPHLQLRYLDHAGYKVRVRDGAVIISRVDGGKMPDVELKRTHVKMPSPDQDCLVEFIAIGQTLYAKLNGESVSLELPANEQPQRQGEVLIYGLNQQPFRDIEVINLDGLPEAEALRLLGVDEQGNDLRGKTASVPPSPSLPVSSSSPNVTIPGLPDLPPLSVPPGEPGLVKEFDVKGQYLKASIVLPDSRRILVFPHASIRLLDLDTTLPLWTMNAENGIFAAAINRDGSHFATYHLFDEKGVGLGTHTGATEARIYLHETASGKLLQSWKTPTDGKDSQYEYIRLTPSGKRIIARVRGKEAAASTFLLFEEGKLEPVERWEAPPGHYGYATHAWKEDAFISTSPAGALLMLPGGKTEPLVTELPKYCSDISPDGAWLVATDGSHKRLGLWNLAERKFTLNLEGSTISRRNIKFAGENLVVMDVNPVANQPPRALECWDRKTGILLARLPMTRPDEFIEGIFTAPNGSFAVLRIKHNPVPPGNEPNLLQIWRLPKPGDIHSSAKQP